jgi:hypothetical protein
MANSSDSTLVQVLRDSAYALRDAATDYDRFLTLVGDARFVFLFRSPCCRTSWTA